MSVTEQYVELLKLTQQYLLQEHTLSDKLLADSETYSYFRNFAAKRMAPKASSPHISPASAPSLPLRAHTTQTTLPPAELPPAKMDIPKNAAPAVDTKLVTSLPSNLNGPIEMSPSSVSVSKPKGEVVPKAEREVLAGNVFIPEPPTSPAEAVDVSEIRKILQQNTSFRLIDTIPSDAEAKKKARLWEQEQLVQVLIICINESRNTHSFLENVRYAIEVYGLNTKLVTGKEIEKHKKWESLLASKSLRLVIASGGDIETSSELRRLYQEKTHFSGGTLGKVPLFLLAEPATYMKDPHLKEILWKSIKEQLVSSS